MNGCYETTQAGYVAGRVTKQLRWDMLQVVLPNNSDRICCRSCYQTTQAGYVAGRVTKQLRWDTLQVMLPNNSGRICCRSCYQTTQAGYAAGCVTKQQSHTWLHQLYVMLFTKLHSYNINYLRCSLSQRGPLLLPG